MYHGVGAKSPKLCYFSQILHMSSLDNFHIPQNVATIIYYPQIRGRHKTPVPREASNRKPQSILGAGFTLSENIEFKVISLAMK